MSIENITWVWGAGQNTEKRQKVMDLLNKLPSNTIITKGARIGSENGTELYINPLPPGNVEINIPEGAQNITYKQTTDPWKKKLQFTYQETRYQIDTDISFPSGQTT